MEDTRFFLDYFRNENTSNIRSSLTTIIHLFGCIILKSSLYCPILLLLTIHSSEKNIPVRSFRHCKLVRDLLHSSFSFNDWKKRKVKSELQREVPHRYLRSGWDYSEVLKPGSTNVKRKVFYEELGTPVGLRWHSLDTSPQGVCPINKCGRLQEHRKQTGHGSNKDGSVSKRCSRDLSFLQSKIKQSTLCLLR